MNAAAHYSRARPLASGDPSGPEERAAPLGCRGEAAAVLRCLAHARRSPPPIPAALELQAERGLLGVCFVDAATGHFTLGQCSDDPQKNCLRTLLAQLRPSEVIFDSTNGSRESYLLLRRSVQENLLSAVSDASQFWTVDAAAKELGAAACCAPRQGRACNPIAPRPRPHAPRVRPHAPRPWPHAPRLRPHTCRLRLLAPRLRPHALRLRPHICRCSRVL